MYRVVRGQANEPDSVAGISIDEKIIRFEALLIVP